MRVEKVVELMEHHYGRESALKRHAADGTFTAVILQSPEGNSGGKHEYYRRNERRKRSKRKSCDSENTLCQPVPVAFKLAPHGLNDR